MPGDNGLAFMNSVHGRNKDAKLILVTGHTTDEMISNMIHLGASGYLRKPFTEEKLLHVIESNLQNE